MSTEATGTPQAQHPRQTSTRYAPVTERCQLCQRLVRVKYILAHIHHQHPETRLAQLLERLRPGGVPYGPS